MVNSAGIPPAPWFTRPALRPATLPVQAAPSSVFRRRRPLPCYTPPPEPADPSGPPVRMPDPRPISAAPFGPPASADLAVFDVTLAPEGPTFRAGPDESILDAALRQGTPLPYGCRNGACGACRGRVLAGRVHFADGAAARPRGLTEREVRAGWTLLCQARASSDLRIAARADGPGLGVRTLPARVASRTRLAHDVMELRLQLPPTERLRYRAGQYVDVLLRDGRRRAFSLANCPTDDAFLVLHVRHVSGGAFSGRVFGEMEERSLLRLQGPLGSFHLRAESDLPVVFLAGGTGFAPIKAIIENALLAPPPRREMHLYWGVRSEPDLYLPELPREWARAHPRLRFVPVLSEPGAGWSGRTGLVHEAVLADFPDLSGHEVYASGPPPMVTAARQLFPDHGLDLERLFFDSFDYAHETGHDG